MTVEVAHFNKVLLQTFGKAHEDLAALQVRTVQNGIHRS